MMNTLHRLLHKMFGGALIEATYTDEKGRQRLYVRNISVRTLWAVGQFVRREIEGKVSALLEDDE